MTRLMTEQNFVSKMPNSRSQMKNSLLSILLASLLFSPSAAFAEERDDYFEVEPESSRPKPKVEAPRPIIMKVEEDETLQEKPGRMSFFKRSKNGEKTTSSDSAKDTPPETAGGGIMSMPKSAAGVMCGMVVGVPVRAAKMMASETKRMNAQVTRDMTWTEGKPDLGAKACGAALGIPYGVATGLMYGLVKGSERAVHTGKRKPFSKESMSLTDPDLK